MLFEIKGTVDSKELRDIINDLVPNIYEDGVCIAGGENAGCIATCENSVDGLNISFIGLAYSDDKGFVSWMPQYWDDEDSYEKELLENIFSMVGEEYSALALICTTEGWTASFYKQHEASTEIPDLADEGALAEFFEKMTRERHEAIMGE